MYASRLQKRYRQLYVKLHKLLKQEGELRIERAAYMLGVSSETLRRVYNSINPTTKDIEYDRGIFRLKKS